MTWNEFASAILTNKDQYVKNGLDDGYYIKEQPYTKGTKISNMKPFTVTAKITPYTMPVVSSSLPLKNDSSVSAWGDVSVLQKTPKRDKSVELFDDETLASYCNDIYTSCFNGDCDKCPMRSGVDENICHVDIILELWRRMMAARPELKTLSDSLKKKSLKEEKVQEPICDIGMPF